MHNKGGWTQALDCLNQFNISCEEFFYRCSLGFSSCFRVQQLALTQEITLLDIQTRKIDD